MSARALACEQCGELIGAPHRLLKTDCILGHADHTERFIGLLCKRHYHWIGDTLRQIQELFALRGTVLLPGPSDGQRHGTREGSPAPGNLLVMAITDARPGNLEHRYWHDDDDAIPDVPGALYSWVRLVAEERDDDELCNINGDVPSIVARLNRERRWIAAQAWVDDYADDLAVLHRFVASAIGDSMWPKSIGKCTACGRKLYNTIGADEVTCRYCQITWSGIALARLRLIHEQEAPTGGRMTT